MDAASTVSFPYINYRHVSVGSFKKTETVFFITITIFMIQIL